MINLLQNKVVVISRIYRKKICSQVVALTDKRAVEWIKESKKDDLKDVTYKTEILWLV